MTLNDLEIFAWPFYVKFSLLRTAFQQLGYIQSVYIHMWPAEMYGSGVADRDPQNIWNPRKNCGSFVTNKANISISYYLVPYCLSADSKTRDLEWPWMAILLWSGAWLSKLGYSESLNRKDQLRHRAVSLRQHGFLVFIGCPFATVI